MQGSIDCSPHAEREVLDCRPHAPRAVRVFNLTRRVRTTIAQLSSVFGIFFFGGFVCFSFTFGSGSGLDDESNAPKAQAMSKPTAVRCKSAPSPTHNHVIPVSFSVIAGRR